MVFLGTGSRALGRLFPLGILLVVPILRVGGALLPERVLSSADTLRDGYVLLTPGGTDVTVANPLLTDPPRQSIPWRRLVSQELRAGRLPFWNPYAYAGSPLLGHFHSAVLDPLALPFLLVERPEDATAVVALLRMVVAGLGVFAFARLVGAAPAGAALAGTIYGGGGVMMVWLMFPLASSAAWFGWIMAAAHRMAGELTSRSLAFYAVAITASVLGGQPEVALLAAVTSAVYFFACRLRARGWAVREAMRAGGALVLAAALTAMLSAVQLLPFLDAMAEGSAGSHRQESAEQLRLRDHLTLRSFLWRADRFALLVFPYLYGRGVDGEPVVPGQPGNFAENSGSYASLVGLVLAVIAFAAAPRRSPARFLGSLGALVWLYHNWFPPLVALTHALPLMKMAVPERAAFIPLLALAVLAGSGYDVVASGASPARRRLVRGAGVALLAGAAAGAVVVIWVVAGCPGCSSAMGFLMRSTPLGWWLDPGLARPSPGQLANLVVYGRLFVAPFAAIALGGAVTLLLSRRRPDLARLLLPALVIADLWFFGSGFNPVLRADRVFPETPAVTAVRNAAQSSRAVFLGYGLPSNAATYYGIRDLAGYDGVNRRRLERAVIALGANDRSSPSEALVAFDRFHPRAFSILGVGVVASPRPLSEPGLVEIGSNGAGWLYRWTSARPLVFAPGEILQARDESEALALLASAGCDPAVCAVVESGPAPLPADARAELSWERPSPVEIRVRSQATQPTTIVISESFDRGWRATVDGRRTEVFPADGALMALVVPAGEHRVVLRFTPISWRLAWPASAVGLGLLVWCLTRTRVRGSRGGRRQG